ncbi:glycosyltransferase family 2 protein [uncultured Clostridium sp.]|uniref:glycosyltransferase family 2 protein n=1 Tax=uncultured Clostridium sp. TaxID=59620 RepID=UPI0025DF95FB|nr:glycosyltransferase family 2 protein [uncultured Clostridium sp.]
MPSVSVIVPIYNVEKYLRKCIDSLINQTIKDIEIILVNDGSPDNSRAICEEYAEADKRIKIINKENGGLSSARNAGFNEAESDYILFVDSDDWINKNMIEILLNEIKKNNADIVQCRYANVIDENVDESINEKVASKIIDNIDALRNLYKNDSYLETVVTWNKLYKKSLFDGIKFPEGKLNEDEFTTHKLLFKCKKIVLIDAKLYYYRKTPDSITNSKVSIKKLDKLEAVKERMKFFESVGNVEIYEKTVVRYGDLLRGSFLMCKYLIDNNEKILNDIDSEYKRIFKGYVKNKYLSFEKKILGFIFYLNPNLCSNIQKMRGKLRSI